MLPLSFIVFITAISASLWIFQFTTAKLFQKKQQKKDFEYNDIKESKISFVIASYNEPENTLLSTISSASSIDLKKEIILVNDGSTMEYSDNFIKCLEKYNVTYIDYKENQGKRHALNVGISEAKHPYIALLDSDTTLNENTIFHALNDLINFKADAVGGNIILKNKDQNFLTKIISGMYWTSFNIERLSQSYFNCMTCCSGGFSLYRAEPLKSIINQITTQKFLNKKCLAGDDRHITSLLIKNGFKTIVSIDGVAKTTTPHSMKSFIRQQQRWTRSLIIELFWSLSPKRIMSFPKIYIFFMLRIIFKYLYLLFAYALIVAQLSNYIYMIIGLLTILCIKAFLSFLFPHSSLNNAINLCLFGLLGFFILSPFLVYASLTPYKNLWGTR